MATSDLRDLLGSISPTSRPTDPLEIFDGLRLRNSGVAELWRPQSDALRLWHDSRELSDVLFKLNTGAGKTLLGLLAAQSLVNETSGKVMVCAALIRNDSVLVVRHVEPEDDYWTLPG